MAKIYHYICGGKSDNIWSCLFFNSRWTSADIENQLLNGMVGIKISNLGLQICTC